MRVAWLIGVLLTAPGTFMAATRVEIYPGVYEVTFESKVLPGVHHFSVVEPQGPRPWPVLFFLHGRGRNHRSLVDVAAVRAQFHAAPMCTIFPQGDDGWYIDSPVSHADRYEAYLGEVIDLAQMSEPIRKDPAHQAIGGWSMGGYGAVRYATRHRFRAVASVIGLVDFPRPADLPAGRNYIVPVPRFGSNPAVWREFNPYFNAGSLRGTDLLVITATDSFDRVMNERFAARLVQLEIPHSLVVLPGGHTFDVVQAAVPPVLQFVVDRIAR